MQKSWFIYKIMLMNIFFSKFIQPIFFIFCTFMTPVLQVICHRHVSLQVMRTIRLGIPLTGEEKATFSTKHGLECCRLT